MLFRCFYEPLVIFVIKFKQKNSPVERDGVENDGQARAAVMRVSAPDAVPMNTFSVGTAPCAIGGAFCLPETHLIDLARLLSAASAGYWAQ
jgi:hypothetical protein